MTAVPVNNKAAQRVSATKEHRRSTRITDTSSNTADTLKVDAVKTQ